MRKFDPIKALEEASDLGFRAVKSMKTGQVNVILTQPGAEKPSLLFVCTDDENLASQIQKLIVKYERNTKDGRGTMQTVWR